MSRPLAPGKCAHRGFTLVEILVVIAIIGILSAIAVPAITGALRTAREGAIRTEIDVIGQAMEAYKLKYGEYPPDFSDWNQVERHYRKAFPNIDDNELKILAQLTWTQGPGGSYSRVIGTGMNPNPDPRSNALFQFHPHALDRAEAIVFCLGGYSSDTTKPFTGQGGPLVLIPFGSSPPSLSYLQYQYNTERENSFFELDTDALSIRQFNIPGDASSAVNPLGISIPYTYSSDELYGRNLAGWQMGTSVTNDAAGIPHHADPFPTYRIGATELPIAYFHSARYNATFGDTPTGATFPEHHYLNVYLPPGRTAEEGVARPYASQVVDTTPPSGFSGPVLEFAEPSRFQIISAGMDNSFGGIIDISKSIGDPGSGGAAFIHGTGQAYNPFGLGSGSISTQDKYADDDILSALFSASPAYGNLKPQLDNVTNFSTRTLESDLP